MNSSRHILIGEKQINEISVSLVSRRVVYYVVCWVGGISVFII